MTEGHQVEIIRKEIIVVDHANLDQDGNLIVVDKDKKSHKVNQRHSSLHPVFQPGMAIELGYGSYMNREFIHTAIQVKKELPDIPKPEVKHDTKSEPVPQELGMWWKELGECLRKDGFFTPDVQTSLKRVFLSHMYSTLNISIEDIKKKIA